MAKNHEHADGPAEDAPTTTRVAKKPLWRRILRGFGYALAGLLLLVVLLVGFIHTSWGKGVVRSRIESRLQARVTGDLRVGDLDYSFFFGDVTLSKLTIADKSGAEAIAIDKLYVDLDRSSILDGKPVLEVIDIDGVRVNLVKNADGTSNLTGLMVPSKRKPMHIRIDRLALANTSVTIRNPDGSVTKVSGANLQGSAEINTFSGDHSVSLETLGASVDMTRADGTRIQVPDLKTSVEASVSDGAIEASVAPISTLATVSRPGKADLEQTISIGAITANRNPNSTRFQIGTTVLGPVSIDEVIATLALKNGEPVGEQVVGLRKLHIDHAGVSEVLGKVVLLSDVDANVEIQGPVEKLIVSGTVATDGGALALAGTANAADRKKPVFDIRLDGSDIDTAKLIALPGDQSEPMRLRSSFSLTAKGRGIPRRPGSTLDVNLDTKATQVNARGREIQLQTISANARLDGKAVTVNEINVDALGLKIGATGSLSSSRNVNGRITIKGNARQAVADLRALGVRIRPLPVALPRAIDLDITAVGSMDGGMDVEIAPTRIPLAGGSVSLSAEARLDRNADGKLKLQTADADVGLRNLDIAKVARIAKRKTTLSGTINGDVKIAQRGLGRDIGFDVVLGLDKPDVRAHLDGTLGARSASVRAKVVRRTDDTTLATIDAELPLTTKRGKRAIAANRGFSLELDVAKRSLAEIKELVSPELAAKIDARTNGGELAAHIELRGTPAAPTGTIRVEGAAELTKLPGKQVSLNLNATLNPTLNPKLSNAGGGVTVRPVATVSVDGVEGELLGIDGAVKLGSLFRNGKLDRAALRRAVLDVEVTVPERSVESLESLSPKVAGIAGNLGLTVKVAGTPKAPTFAADGAWDGFTSASGKTSSVRLSANGSASAIAVDLGLGGTAAQPIAKLRAEIDRGADALDVRVVTDAKSVALVDVLPKRAAEHGLDIDYGVLNSDFATTVHVSQRDGVRAVEKVSAKGALTITGASAVVPGSSRKVKDIEVRIEGRGDVAALALAAVEADEQNQNRKINIAASVGISKGKPTAATATIKAEDWLVFGGTMGPADAPKASLNADIAIDADLSGQVPELAVTVHAMKFSEPERFLRDHGLEQVAIGGDIMFTDASGVRVGKIGPQRDPNRVVPPPRKRTPMNVKVSIPQPIRLTKSPIDAEISGDLEIVITEDAMTPVGVLEVHGGSVSLFGHPHPYIGGELRFDADNPKGSLSLVFARPLPPAVLRELSRRSGGDSVKILIAGSVAKRDISLAGAGNSGLLEVMSSHNAGRALRFTEPGLPSSNSVQLPRGEQPLVLTYLATNLPHLLLFDRFSAWSDPYDRSRRYGQVDNFFGERTTGKRRVRVVARPENIGRSNVELQVDRVLVNSAGAMIGAGVRAGSRLGGGVALFFEWASKD